MGVVLAGQIAILGVAAVAEVRPEAVESPAVFWEELALGLEAGVCAPELCGKHEAPVGFGAASVDIEWVLGWAGEEGWLQDAGMVEG